MPRGLKIVLAVAVAVFLAAIAFQHTVASEWCAAEDELECTTGGWVALSTLLASAATITLSMWAWGIVRATRRWQRRRRRERRRHP